MNTITSTTSPTRRKGGKLSTAEGKKGVQFVEQIEEVNHVQGVAKDNAFNNPRPNSPRRPTIEPKNLYKRMERLAEISRNDSKPSPHEFRPTSSLTPTSPTPLTSPPFTLPASLARAGPVVSGI
ncbi:hypothetical protein G7Y79_00011g030760 [Physcia stellaris]|nr:hypothetical protein G7Y79_00011g030760 [Physcia stellaris]